MKLPSISLGTAVAAISVGVAFAVVVIGSISVSMTNQDRVVMGVQSDGTTLAGMTKNEVHTYFEKSAKGKLTHKAAFLTYQKLSWTITPEDISLQANVDEAADAAYQVGRNASLPVNLFTQLKCALFGTNIKLTASYDHDQLTQKLNQIKQDVHTDPVNATAQLQANGTIKKTPAVTGLTLDIEPLQDSLGPQLEALQLTAKAEVSPEKQEPFITNDDLSAIDSVLAAYTTRFSPGDRGDNIGLAASQLQGALIRSQSTLSFNNIVGHRTRSAGYKNAGVIVNGEPAIDVGGGVCQVSSTLYNAVLLAGMKPTERCNHSLPSSYVPRGRDATVADDLLDLAFQNPLPHPVYLRVSNTGSALTIYVLGTKADLEGKTITLVTNGSASHPSLYRIRKQNGQVIDKEFLHTDSYS